MSPATSPQRRWSRAATHRAPHTVEKLRAAIFRGSLGGERSVYERHHQETQSRDRAPRRAHLRQRKPSRRNHRNISPRDPRLPRLRVAQIETAAQTIVGPLNEGESDEKKNESNRRTNPTN